MPAAAITCPVCESAHVAELSDAQSQGQEPFVYRCPDLDRRFRLMGFHVETRRSFCHGQEIDEESLQHMKSQFGGYDFESKFERWRKIDYPPFGSIEEYSERIDQIINAYSMGHTYPAAG